MEDFEDVDELDFASDPDEELMNFENAGFVSSSGNARKPQRLTLKRLKQRMLARLANMYHRQIVEIDGLKTKEAFFTKFPDMKKEASQPQTQPPAGEQAARQLLTKKPRIFSFLSMLHPKPQFGGRHRSALQ